MPVKDPDARLDYDFDWKPLTHGVKDAKSDWLGASETISSFTVTKSPTDSAATIDASTQADGIVKVWLSGGSARTAVSITCHITTNEGRTDERTRRIDIRER